MLYFLFFGLSIFLLLKVSVYGLTWYRVANTTYQCCRYQLKQDHEVPEYINSILRKSVQELEQLGFRMCGYLEAQSIVAGVEQVGALLHHPHGNTYAEVLTNPLPDSATLIGMTFHSFLRNLDGSDTLLMTLNGKAHSVISNLPNTILQDEYVLEISQHWQVHKAKLETLQAQTNLDISTPQDFLAALEAHIMAYVDHLVNSNQWICVKDISAYRLKSVPAIRFTWKLISGGKNYSRFLKQQKEKAKSLPETSVEIPVEVEVRAFQQQKYLEQKRLLRRRGKSGLLLLSLGTFVLSFMPMLVWEDVLILVGILFLHELGHFGMMRLFGYQNTTIFFLPFFGAAASGRKDHATSFEKFWVLLAGPLPGLILGFGLAIAALSLPILEQAPLATGIGFLVAINYINLLPIFPLDGGRIFNLLLFSRNAWAEFTLKIVTTTLLVFTGQLILALLVGLTIQTSFRNAKVLERLAEANPYPEDDSDASLQSIFRAIKQAGYGNEAFTQRHTMAKEILQRCQEPQAALSVRLSLLSLYLTCLGGGLVLIIWLFLVPLFESLMAQ